MTALRSLQGAAAPETVILARDVYDLVQVVATVSAATALLLIVVLLAQALVEFRRTISAIEGAGRRIRTDRGVESLRKTVSHVESISGRFREEAEKLSGSVSSISDRLTQASGVIEGRIEEFSALMELVQREAEDTFVDSAAVARGVRAGLDNLRGADASGRSGDGLGDADENRRDS